MSSYPTDSDRPTGPTLPHPSAAVCLILLPSFSHAPLGFSDRLITPATAAKATAKERNTPRQIDGSPSRRRGERKTAGEAGDVLVFLLEKQTRP